MSPEPRSFITGAPFTAYGQIMHLFALTGNSLAVLSQHVHDRALATVKRTHHPDGELGIRPQAAAAVGETCVF
jgi:hypothetical protein